MAQRRRQSRFKERGAKVQQASKFDRSAFQSMRDDVPQIVT
jgi:hypothetical protein